MKNGGPKTSVFIRKCWNYRAERLQGIPLDIFRGKISHEVVQHEVDLQLEYFGSFRTFLGPVEPDRYGILLNCIASSALIRFIIQPASLNLASASTLRFWIPR